MGLLRSIVPANPAVAAAVGLLLALPVSLVFAIAAFRIEPLHGLLEAWSTAGEDARQTIASFIALLVTFLLLPVGSYITLASGLRGGRRMRLLNLALGIAMLGVFVAILGAVFLDQLPCLVGEPDCD